MNRLIIIGNGFDLANGLKTSYEDFLVWYLKSKIENVLGKRDNYSDSLIEINFNHEHTLSKFTFSEDENINQLLTHNAIYWTTQNRVAFKHSNQNIAEKRMRPISISIKSQFFADLIAQKSNWTDIEKTYFNALLDTKSQKRYLPSKYRALNREFECLKKELSEYIGIIDKKNCDSIEKIDLFKLPKGSSFYHLLGWYPNDKRLKQVVDSTKTEYLIVNFNYTNTVRTYRSKLKDAQDFAFPIIDIHGNCLNDDIIFGYGDESHPKYQELEDQDDNELLKNMKSFHYGFSKDYSKLMAFIENPFTVDIIGHSLGLSDRLLFREIFERENCKEIKLFHRGSRESYFNKRIALSRHFKDNTNMRNKVLEYDENDVF